jgi:hypothetical protein
MKSLLVVQVERRADLCSSTNGLQDMDQIAGTWQYITLLPDFRSILFSSRMSHTARILNSLDTADLFKSAPLVPKHTR